MRREEEKVGAPGVARGHADGDRLASAVVAVGTLHLPTPRGGQRSCAGGDRCLPGGGIAGSRTYPRSLRALALPYIASSLASVFESAGFMVHWS